MKFIVFLALGLTPLGVPAIVDGSAPVARPKTAAPAAWTFVVSGDSRNCGDLIMPVIARDATARHARFYWHLGDLRALFEIDEDYAGLHALDLAKLKLNLLPPSDMETYLKNAWQDFLDNQFDAFKVPFFLGIGNHESIGRTREQFISFFRKQLNTTPIQQQRELDSPGDSAVRTYFHWRQQGIDFVYLDNASNEFDAPQLDWFNSIVAKIEADPSTRALVVGMHESLPFSYSVAHSMNDAKDHGDSGLGVYKRLLDFRKKGKAVYVLSSHSHFFLADLYNTAYWQSQGGVLPGYLIGTAGAQHYSVPPTVKEFTQYAENQYGYLTVTVSGDPKSADPLTFRFVPIKRKDLLPETVSKFGKEAVNFCFTQNWNATVPGTGRP